MNGREAVEYIHSTSWLGSRPGLERISELCSLMENPQDRLRVIHVAGTNGKGSFCSMLSSVLTACGYKTGLFTSPYVVSFNERIRIDGKDIPDDKLGEVTEAVGKYAESMKDHPTEFELLTAVAFEYFAREECDFVVMEAGLGGRLDSTNVISKPIMSVITGVALDHTEYLGDTTEKIAREKAGIIKSGVPVVFGEGDCSARRVIRETADNIGSSLTETDYSLISDEESSLAGSSFKFGGAAEAYKIALVGKYQIKNAALVLSAVDVLRKIGVKIPESSLRAGLAAARWRARFELLSENPDVIYDGAHNPQGIDAAVRNIKHFFGETRPIILTGVMADKDHEAMTRALAPIARLVHTVKPDNPRAMDASALAAEFETAGVRAVSHGNMIEAVRAALNDAEREPCPLIALGTLYMYADFVCALSEVYENNKGISLKIN